MPDTLLSLVQLGCLTIDEANEYLSLWGEEVAKKDRKKLVGQLKQERLKSVWERFKNNGDKLVVRGRVKNLTDFGAFIALIDFDCIDGLLHITDMSWKRIKHPDELLKIGQDIEVKILDIDVKRARISLGLKQLTPNPWDSVSERFPVGTHVKGRVRNLAKYGAFVEIAPGIEGLIHVSEFSWMKKITRADEVLSIGDEVEVVVLSVDVEKQSIALSIRKAMPNPWDRMPNRYPVGSRARGKVRNFTRYGAFIELEEGIDGMIHVNEMSWTRKIDHPSECLNIGDEVEAIVLNVDPEKRQIGLGLKQLQQNPWPEIIGKYAIGMVITSHVTKLVSFGAFVELEPGIDGLIHVSEISNKPIEKAKDVLSIGEEVTARVIKVDREAGRIALSIKALSMTEEELKTLKDKNGIVAQESQEGSSLNKELPSVNTESE